MLVIVSDLHLADGTSGETIREGAFRAFRERLRDLAYDASWRKAPGESRARYEPVKELDLILLGDILDVIRSTKWLEGAIRPWDPPTKQEFVDKVREINDAILEQNKPSLTILRSLDNGKTMTLPPATANGNVELVSREPDSPRRVPVKVRIHYMVGNHDWFYHLPGNSFDQIRSSVVTAMGLSNPPDQPFPHEPAESQAVAQVLEDHGVFARHGDIFDVFNFEGDRNASSLGDAIVVELLNRFPTEVRRHLGSDLPAECAAGLDEIDNVRPLLVIPVWIDGLLNRTCRSMSVRKRVKDVWDRLVDDFLRLPFVRKHDKALNPFDTIDRMELALKFSRGVSLAKLSLLFTWLNEKIGHRTEKFYSHALEEETFKNRQAHFVVYGHTHHHEIVPLDCSAMAGGQLNQMYVNSGTWRRVHELAQCNPKEQEFIGYNVMTYLAFFKSGERCGKPFETWSGALGIG